IPAGTPFYPRLVDWGAHCNDMMIMAGAKVEIYNCYLNVHGDLEVRGELEMTSNQAKMIVYQDITWQLGAVADIQTGSAEIWVRGDWFFASNSSIHLDLGYVEFEEDGNSEIICRSDDSYFHHLRIDKNTGSWVANSDNSTYPLIVNGNFHNYENSQFIGHSMNSTIFRGSFNNYPGAHFSYPNGTVRFEGVNQHINLNSGDYFNDLVIAGSVFLDSGIIIEDDLVIESGSLVSDSNTIQITGDWTDEVGFGGFGEGTGIVVFNGYGTQKINGETFATLRINKNNGELRFTTGITYCDDLDWIDGAMRVNGGEFTALDINNTSLDHDLTVTSGMLEIHKSSDYLDINNVLTLEGGEIHIIGASSSDSYWAWSGPVEINISGGVLDYHDTGIRICDDYLLVDNITGGVIRTTGDFTSERADFDIAGGTLELYGDVDAELDMTTGSSLYNLTINKVSVRTETGSEHDIFLQQDSKTGLIIERQRSENVVAVNNLDINGNFTLQHGNLEAPTFMRVAGDWANNAGLDFFDEDNGAVTFDGDQNSHLYSNERFYNLFINKDIVGSNSLYVNSGKTIKVTNTLQVADGILDIEEGVNLFLDNEFRVEEGGTLIFNGLESNPCKVSSSCGFYSFQVQAGSEISAEYTEFEYMNSAGINVMNGASITADKAFNNCTFLNGETGGTLLTIDNAQNLNIYEAAFPSDFLVRGTNVTKNLDQGFVYLYDAQGSFAGEDYDNDSHDRIEWMHRAELEITSVNWSDQEPFAGDDIFCEVTVTNNGLAYSMPCFLDIYYNQVLPPAPMIPGDQYEYIDAIAPAESTLIIFEEISSFTVLQWFSWLQVDTDQIVNEVDEENNIWGADNINWLPIPPVDDLTIGRNMNREGALYLSWYYPIPVTRFAIHGDVIPGFAISQNNLIDNTTSFYYLITPQNEKYFYRVIAVRDSTARTDFIKDKYIPKRIYSSHGSQR
ncbi:MAG: hypothetical protein JXB60_06690, partial [Candidatus Cloacimonetes bacterium]|nr:hypothetical protein [Candidatus Cloacimonadota bacterium]